MFSRSPFSRTPFSRGPQQQNITVVSADTFREVVSSIQIDVDTLRTVSRPADSFTRFIPSVFNLDRERVAILENATSPDIFERLNGEYTLSFSLPATDPKMQYVVEENYIETADGEWFIIKEISDGRDASGMTLANVFCEHVFFSMIDDYIEDRRVVDASATAALAAVLEGTEFTPGIVNLGTYATAYFVRMNPIAGINRIIERWGGEIRPRKWTVDLLTRRGSDRGVQFRYRKNLLQVRRTVDTRGIVTRLYPFGYDALTIESVNGGVKYIESPNIGMWPRPKIREVIFDLDEPAALLAAAQEYLAKNDLPLVSYEVDVAELKTLVGYGQFEEFELGDDIKVVDEELGIDIKARIVEYERYPLEPWRSRVTLANFRPGLEDEVTKFKATRNFVNRIKSGDEGYVSANWLQGVIDTLKARLLASAEFSDAEVRENVGLMFENTNPTSPAYGALYIGPGMFAIANTKVGGEWDWRTFGTGAGFSADLLNAGKIRTDLIDIESSDGKLQLTGNLLRILDGAETKVALGVYDAGKPPGLLLNGGEIYSTKIRSGGETDASYIQLNSGDSPLEVYHNHKLALSIWRVGGGGSVQFFDSTANDMRCQMITMDDVRGQGLRIQGRTSGGSARDINIDCRYASIDATDGIDLEPGSGTINAYGDFHATGTLTAGNKLCTEETTQGVVGLFTRESPEQRYIDEGRAELTNGECRVDLDLTYLECIESDSEESPWYIYLTPKGPFTVYEAEIGDSYFAVKSHEPGVSGKFTWKISATRRDKSNIRFPRMEWLVKK